MASIDRFGDMAVFVRVAEAGGFGAAARGLGISTSHTSRTVARLEERLGVRLFHRTTRRVSLTEAGRSLLARASVLLADLDEAEAAIADRGSEPRGTVKLTTPVHFGVRYVAPIAVDFTRKFPGIHFDISFDDRRVDVVAEGFDLAVRIGPLSDSSLMSRRLGHTRSLVVASPEYLAARPAPKRPADLKDHAALVHGADASGANWRFSNGESDLTVRVQSRFTVNNPEGLVEAALSGLGVARLPDALAAPAVKEGRLVRLLVPWETDVPISAVYPPGRHLTRRVRAFVDFLAERLIPAPWLA